MQGVQEIKVQPNGAIIPDAAAAVFATEYFGYTAPKYVALDSVWCGMKGGQPACAVEASVESTGILIPRRTIKVTSLAYLVYGITRGQQ